MQIHPIADARRFSLREVQRQELVAQDGLVIELLCFEAGQHLEGPAETAAHVYQVLEGEALVREGGASKRLGKGVLATFGADTEYTVENAGGGLLVMMRTRRA